MTDAQRRELAEIAARAFRATAPHWPTIDLMGSLQSSLPTDIPWPRLEPIRLDPGLFQHMEAAIDVTHSLRSAVFDGILAGVHLPRLDIPTFDVARPMPQLPAVDVQRMLRHHIPAPGDLIPPGVQELIDSLFARYPANWPMGEEALDLDLAQQIVENEGIPIVYIPRADIVSELAQAPDRAGRDAILVARTSEILDDCAAAVDSQLDPLVAEQRPLLLKAIAALADGHHEAAQALGVSVCNTQIEAHIDNKSGKAKHQCRVTNLEVAFQEDRLRYVLGVAPVVNLLTDWNPKSGKPRPVPLSRHVVAHQAHPDHFTPENAVLAVMVATSLMLALDERYSWPTD
ncbi:hypothetical protein CRM89_29895 [Nocardia sp. FDAARGOS_372]|uniref:Uncharacterized protein n=2 Tax=Nocardiaceae TaxID=85025 RepID=Q5YM55_NOCFA|nr:hypothetical protein CRM89_29895 [Nocardia sp. FDAARGOS_372]BAD60736.1 hypothetical protein PNF2_500 [Nocardia farcinica IFM 10152]